MSKSRLHETGDGIFLTCAFPEPVVQVSVKKG